MNLDVLKMLKLNAKLNNLLEGFDDFLYTKKINLTIKDKILIFLYEKPLSPFELIKMLSVAKTNLALVCQSLIKEDLIKKQKDEIDKRNIVYLITEKGKLKAGELLKEVSKIINNEIEYKNKNAEINAKISELLSLIS